MCVPHRFVFSAWLGVLPAAGSVVRVFQARLIYCGVLPATGLVDMCFTLACDYCVYWRAACRWLGGRVLHAGLRSVRCLAGCLPLVR